MPDAADKMEEGKVSAYLRLGLLSPPIRTSLDGLVADSEAGGDIKAFSSAAEQGLKVFFESLMGSSV